MLEILLVVAAGTVLWWQVTKFHTTHPVTSPRAAAKLKRLWSYAEKALREKRFNAAEKALLSILKIDHKNTMAYNRLGVLYARQKNFDDAVECFEIASSLTPTVASLYNLGLVYYEQADYTQAANSFERVVDLEPTAKRWIAFAKALDQLGQRKRTIAALEKAIELDPSESNLEMLAQIHDKYENIIEAEDAKDRLQNLKQSLAEKTNLPKKISKRKRPPEVTQRIS